VVTFVCPRCEQERTGVRRRCHPCTSDAVLSPEAIEKGRRTRTGVRRTEEQKRRIREGVRRHRAAGGRSFDIATYMRSKPHPFALPVGTERIVKDGRVSVKCEDGKWRYRSRLVWEKANGAIPLGLVIHHVNENPLDDRLENLQMLTVSEHRTAHNTPEKMRARQALTVAARKRNGSYGRRAG